MTGIELIAAERDRQVSVEGWTPEHDDEHYLAEMARAAIVYAELAAKQACDSNVCIPPFPDGWPWAYAWWKPSTDPIRNLVKAGALIAAEIDRLKRAAEARLVADPDADRSLKTYLRQTADADGDV